MYLELLKKLIEQSVLKVLAFKEYLSQSWQKGANRRTLLLLLLIGSMVLYSYLEIVSPPNAFPVDALVEVREGVLLDELGEHLERENVIKSGLAFGLTVRALGKSSSLRAGDYLFKEPKGLFAVIQAITTGAYGLEPIRIRVPEGATTKEMGVLFAKHLQRVDAERFAAAAFPYEGYLYPDTYFFLPNATEESIIRAMRQNFDTQLEAIIGDVVAFGKPLSDVVKMASMLEREAYIFDDRRKIAGVLWRRLDEDMRLQVDATFLYSIGRTTFDLTRKDLQSKEDPYNTYVHKGLPPTPIGSPSLSSLRAAVTPIDTGGLFYLADRQGTTYYSATYEEHLRKKRLYLGT